MPKPSKPSAESVLKQLAERPQIDFEMEFYDVLLTRVPDFTEVLNAQAGNYAAAGRFADGLKVVERIVRLRPRDAVAHYNLACRHARLKHHDLAISALKRAIELGFRDFRSMNRDDDLATLRKDPRFRQLLRDYSKS